MRLQNAYTHTWLVEKTKCVGVGIYYIDHSRSGTDFAKGGSERGFFGVNNTNLNQERRTHECLKWQSLEYCY